MMDRPDLFVIGRLLEGLVPGPLLRTQLQQRAGVNYTVFQRYLDFLLRLGIVAVRPGDDGLLELTPKGVEAYRFLSEGFGRIFGIAPPSRRS
ncbi:MAG: winged helix-turn-helix domain-containing protein [Thermoplasmata archaeon]|nr:winged helix-turn-helix domain-containing protein [Thermoplasmata archaeon]